MLAELAVLGGGGLLIAYLVRRYAPASAAAFKGHTLPPGSLGVPVLGETIQILTGSHEWLVNRVKKYGSVSRSYVLFSDVIILGNKEGADIFHDTSKIIRKDQLPSFIKSILPNNVGSKHGEEHSSAKGVVYAGLAASVIDRAVPEFTRSLRQRLEAVRGKSSIRLGDVLMQWNFEALCTILFSEVDVDPKLAETYIRVVKDGTGSPPVDLPFTPFGRAVREVVPVILPWVEAQIRKHVEHEDRYAGDGLSAMLRANARLTSPMSESALAREVHHFIAAGLIVSGPLLFLLQNLQQRPDILASVVEEARGAEYNAAIGVLSEDTRKFPLLSCAFFESRRVSPGVKFGFGRTLVAFNHTTAEGATVLVPENWWVILSYGSVHLDPANHPDPVAFRPSRFAQRADDDEGLMRDMSVVGGGGGNIVPKLGDKLEGHGCPGVRLTRHMVLAAVLELLRFDWLLVDPHSPPTDDVIAAPKDGGLLVRLA